MIFYAIWTFLFLVAGACSAALANYVYLGYGGIYNCRPAAGAGSVSYVRNIVIKNDWTSKTHVNLY